MDNRRQWYRYQRLFADFLQHRLHRVYPDEVVALHSHAARWYADNHFTDEAIHQALQHSALPLMADWQWAVYRFGSTLPIAILLILYLRIRRLLPAVIAHWVADFFAILSAVVLPLLAS